MANSRLYELKAFDQSVWIDEIRREFLESGVLKRMIDEDGLTGMTTNPSIFEKAVSESTLYDEEIKNLAGEDRSPAQMYDALTWNDVQRVADMLRPVYEQTDGRDGYVSVEVPASLAYNSQASIAEAVRIWEAVNRRNIFIKIPGTHEGTKAIRELTARGINVNVTLLFSRRQYSAAACAYLDGVLDRLTAGKDVKKLFSVASIFVSRIDTAVDKQIDALLARDTLDPGVREELHDLRGEAAVANTKHVYQRFKELWEQERFKEARAKGANVQRMVWGSTSTKDPAYKDVKYVEGLIGPYTINTIPKKTIDAFRDHGRAALTIEQEVDDALCKLEKIEAAGINLEKIYDTLQEEGVDAFDKSLRNLFRVIQDKKRTLVST